MTLEEIKKRIEEIDVLLKDSNYPKKDKKKLRWERANLALTKSRCKKIFNLSKEDERQIDKDYNTVCWAIDELEEKDHNFEYCSLLWEVIEICAEDALIVYEKSEKERMKKKKKRKT